MILMGLYWKTLVLNLTDTTGIHYVYIMYCAEISWGQAVKIKEKSSKDAFLFFVFYLKAIFITFQLTLN